MLDWPDFWLEDRSFSCRNVVPIDTCEEFVLLYFFSISVSAESFAWVSVQQEQDDLSSFLWHRVWNLEWALLDVFKQLRFARVEVGRNSN